MNSPDAHAADGARPLSPFLFSALALVGFGPLVGQFLFNLWKFDTYQFFPLALAGAGLLFSRGLIEARRPLKPGSKVILVPLVVIILGLLGTASLLWSPWMGALAFLLAIVATAWWLGGWKLVKSIFPGWLLLITVLPPPLKLDTRFALLLQEWATAGSSRVLALLGIPHFLSGMIIEIPDHRLLIEEACSGINSVLFMTSACVFYAMWQRRALWFLLLLYALTISCVLAGNLFRITSGAWAFYHFQIDLFSGWRHEALGLVLTGTYLVFIVIADTLLGPLATMHGMRKKLGAIPAENYTPILQGRYFEGGIKFLAFLLVIIGAAQLVRGWDFHFRKENARKINPAGMDGSARFHLPQVIDGWQLVSDVNPVPKSTAFEDGIYSHIWQYSKGGLTATLSLDYPFFGYHDVTVCYRNVGWKVEETKLQRASRENDLIPSMEAALLKEGGLMGSLFYSTVDETGVWLEEPGTRSPYDEEGKPLQEGNLAARLTHRFRLIPYANEAYDKAINYRIQLLAAARGGLGTAQRRDVEKLFHQARLLLAEQFVKPRAIPAPTPTPALSYEPLPDSTPDATRQAIMAAMKADAESSAPKLDATKKAVLEAIKAAKETEALPPPPDATQKAIQGAIQEANENKQKE
jgi:exosortase